MTPPGPSPRRRSRATGCRPYCRYGASVRRNGPIRRRRLQSAARLADPKQQPGPPSRATLPGAKERTPLTRTLVSLLAVLLALGGVLAAPRLRPHPAALRPRPRAIAPGHGTHTTKALAPRVSVTRVVAG